MVVAIVIVEVSIKQNDYLNKEVKRWDRNVHIKMQLKNFPIVDQENPIIIIDDQVKNKIFFY